MGVATITRVPPAGTVETLTDPRSTRFRCGWCGLTELVPEQDAYHLRRLGVSPTVEAEVLLRHHAATAHGLR